jgi:hemolysin III
MYPGERFNGYSHLIGLILAGVGAAWLLRKIYPWDDLQQTGAAVIFTTSGVLLYAASIWHLFVLGGTAVHYISIGAFVL